MVNLINKVLSNDPIVAQSADIYALESMGAQWDDLVDINIGITSVHSGDGCFLLFDTPEHWFVILCGVIA